MNAAFPDGGHPSLPTAHLIAMTIATALDGLAHSRQ
jgi:hypothetical protein